MRGTKQARQHGFAPVFLVMAAWLMSSPGLVQAQHNPEVDPMEKPDLNRDGQVDVLDLVGLLHLFQ